MSVEGVFEKDSSLRVKVEGAKDKFGCHLGEPFELLNLYFAYVAAGSRGRTTSWAGRYGVSLEALALVEAKVVELERLLHAYLKDDVVWDEPRTYDHRPLIQAYIFGTFDNWAVQKYACSDLFETSDGRTCKVPKWEAIHGTLERAYGCEFVIVATGRERLTQIKYEVRQSFTPSLTRSDPAQRRARVAAHVRSGPRRHVRRPG